jgi:drug/metabolite transporter (DMT)-like permease
MAASSLPPCCRRSRSFSYLLAGDRLGAVAWVGAAVILGGMLVAEPALLDWLRRWRRGPLQDML